MMVTRLTHFQVSPKRLDLRELKPARDAGAKLRPASLTQTTRLERTETVVTIDHAQPEHGLTQTTRLERTETKT